MIYRESKSDLENGSGFLHRFPSVESIPPMPEEFPYPFAGEAHPVAVFAAKEMQVWLNSQAELQIPSDGPGKMMGVLVVTDCNGQPGYLAAFSGKWANTNHVPGFVPPVFDTLNPDGFYRHGEEDINAVNREIATLENASEYKYLIEDLAQQRKNAEEDIRRKQQFMSECKQARKQRRQEMALVEETHRQQMLTQLEEESIRQHYELKETKKQWKSRIEGLEAEKERMEEAIVSLKNKRRQMSAHLQKGLFESYSFLNANDQRKDLLDIFSSEEGMTPPSGAGECAAPKLLQFAYKHSLKPKALAEFWWGPSPPSEIRKHGYFYPSCRSKCLPILGHMLDGITVGADSTKENPAEGKDLPIVFEDDHIIVVNKPAEFLSVPGKSITDSVYTRIAAKCPDATGPMVVHRLDMSTSGLMLLAKSKDVHQHLQSQFLKRKVKKSYIAILEGVPDMDGGEINLPLRVDLDHRPRQVVCYKYGKPALTKWEKLSVSNGCTRVRFYPITGRTHQLRVHSAHTSGLNIPIKGDDLYGKRAERLYLHAESITFQHPVTGKSLTLEVLPEF